MITIELNDHTAEDVKCIQELQAMGFSDEYIQELYNKSLKTEKDNERKAD
jgi:SOS response regulatory protein OraA/RecX